ncbi:hypothetical protein, partial [Mesorhizobium sp.]|uniref:hypothetical protein n=1 Tax=Mesorhizobium sp. TaxID=1871066 RepID=UPI0025D60E4A
CEAEGRVAANDLPVFDVAHELPRLFDERGDGEWRGSSVRAARGQLYFRYGMDGPHVQWRREAQAARLTSKRYSGQHANDNKDWPLGKLLRAENNDHCLALAERYRAMYDAASEPTELVGKDLADNIYMMVSANFPAPFAIEWVDA